MQLAKDSGVLDNQSFLRAERVVKEPYHADRDIVMVGGPAVSDVDWLAQK